MQHVFTVTAAGMAVIAFGALSTINHESSLPFGSMSVLVLAIALFILDILKQRSYAFFLYTILYGAFFGVIFKDDISSFTKVFLNILFLYLFMGICLRICKPKLTSYKFFFLIGLISCAFTILFGWAYGFSIAEIIISLAMIAIFTSLAAQKLPRIHAYYSHRNLVASLTNLSFMCSLEFYKDLHFIRYPLLVSQALQWLLKCQIL